MNVHWLAINNHEIPCILSLVLCCVQSATADTAAATSPQEEQQQQHEEPPTGMAPYYLLKLAQESGSTVVPSWLANQFHPNHHHFFFTLDWHKGAGRKLSNDEYLSACEAENAQLQQQLQQEASQQEPPAEQQQQQDGMQGTNQQQQQRPGLPFWIPDGSDPGSQVHSEEQRHEVVGAYVLSAMEQPQHDASVKPIHASRQDPKGKVVSLEDCVEAFLQPEQLSEADEWYCPKCRTHVQVGLRRRADVHCGRLWGGAVCEGIVGHAFITARALLQIQCNTQEVRFGEHVCDGFGCA
jgi:hypothetical protein